MPETGIGFFPDVGGGYFLPRLPGEIGMYLALTGARIKAADCIYAGVATHFVPAGRVEELTTALADAGAAVDPVLTSFVGDPGEPGLAAHCDTVDRCFGAASVSAVLAALDAEPGAWAAETAAAIRRVSPTSLRVAFRQIRAGADLSFEHVMGMEYRLSQRFNTGHDYFEGIRAAIVDKDRSPNWAPAILDDVSDTDVDAYFAPVPEELTFD